MLVKSLTLEVPWHTFPLKTHLGDHLQYHSLDFRIIVLSKFSVDISEICPNPEPKIGYFELFT
jgi:hypothetical protein